MRLVLTTRGHRTAMLSRQSTSGGPKIKIHGHVATSPSPTVSPSSTDTATPTPSPTSTSPSPTGDVQPQFPIRAAFYYPWFPETWGSTSNPFTNYHPSLGLYDSSDASVIANHIRAMQYGGIQAGIASWWGQGTKTDGRISNLLRGADGTDFRWSLYYEQEAQGDPTVAQIQNDLQYIQNHYGNDPNFLRVNGRFVVFVYADANDGARGHRPLSPRASGSRPLQAAGDRHSGRRLPGDDQGEPIRLAARGQVTLADWRPGVRARALAPVGTPRHPCRAL